MVRILRELGFGVVELRRFTRVLNGGVTSTNPAVRASASRNAASVDWPIASCRPVIPPGPRADARVRPRARHRARQSAPIAESIDGVIIA